MAKFTITNHFTHLLSTENTYHRQNQIVKLLFHFISDFNVNAPKLLDGIFSFVLYDTENNDIFVARDPIGIIPLYYGLTKDNEIMFASEAKCLKEDCTFITTFPPGNYLKISSKNNLTREDRHILKSREGQSTNVCFVKYYNPNYDNDNVVINDNNDCNDIDELTTGLRERLTNSVQKRLMTDVPYAVLLSGGLDSSLVASITSRMCEAKGEKLHSFSIGLKGAPDLVAARKVARFLEQSIMRLFSLYRRVLIVSAI